MKASPARKAQYPIRAVSKLTGVSIDTLRAWERRYQAVTPSRDDRGRLYSEADIVRLRLLNQAVLAGHGIGRVAALSDDELQRLQLVASEARPSPAKSLHAGFAAALSRYDSMGVDRELARLAALMSPADLVRDILLPTLREVGDEWTHDRSAIAREHLTSAAMRHLLGSFLRLHAHAGSSVRLVFATPSGDPHEIGTVGAAMLAASRGFAVSYLGPDLPADQILEAVKAAGDVTVLVLGVTLPGRALASQLGTIVTKLPGGVELWTGGSGAMKHHRLISTRGLVLENFDAYLQQLARLSGRVA